MSHMKWFDVQWHHHEYTQEQETEIPRGKRWFFFTNIEKQNKLYVWGVTSRLLLEETHIQVSICSMYIFSY